jgi:hypothetical protein
MANDKNESNDVTGRDGLVMAKALWYALKYIEGLPENLREWSDQQDMKAVLVGRFPGGLDAMQRTYSAWLQMLREDPEAAAEWAAHPQAEREAIRRHRAPPDILDEKRHPYFSEDAKPQ